MPLNNESPSMHNREVVRGMTDGPTKSRKTPEGVARALGVVEDQTLAALRKLKQLGWVWDGKDWVYDYKGNIVGISET